MQPIQKISAVAAFLIKLIVPALAAEPPSYGPQLEGFSYPFPLAHFAFESQGKSLEMGYLDVAAASNANGQTAVLLHGKNFCGATWESTIRALSQVGYRVIAPDQIGFCTSSKPTAYQYSFQQFATNTHALLEKLGVQKAVLIAHSTGGMLATRYSLMFPDAVSKLVLVNPIGLEDWKAKGVPYRSVDQWYARELKLSAESVKAYELKTYYVGRWRPEFDKWVEMLAGLNRGPGHEIVAWNSALIYDMIFTQPVVYEFPNLKVPTVLMIGDMDNTAIGGDGATPEVRAQLGHYDVLGKQIAAMIPKSRLIEFPELGHAPQIEQPDRFNSELLKALAP
jgi:pimeloyl-ACP methyl ester carboxylesterase